MHRSPSYVDMFFLRGMGTRFSSLCSKIIKILIIILFLILVARLLELNLITLVLAKRIFTDLCRLRQLTMLLETARFVWRVLLNDIGFSIFKLAKR